MCSRIDFGEVQVVTGRRHDTTNVGVVLDGDASRFLPPLQTGCAVCKILSTCGPNGLSPRLETKSTAQFELRAFSFLRNCPWADLNFSGAQESALLLVVPKDLDSPTKCVMDAGYVVVYPDGTQPGLFRPRLVPQSFDCGRVHMWLRSCKEFHGPVCSEPTPIVAGMKLIDCETRRIVVATPSMAWLALSYVWGKHDDSSSHDALTAALPGLPSTASRLVNDAVRVTTSLGYRFLWIDKYCIDQRNPVEKEHQIKNMDLIYLGAELTIVAAAGADEYYGLPGIGLTRRSKQMTVQLPGFTLLSTGPDPLSEIEKSRWWTRGWTFQEAFLSRRKLVFTEHQTYFECGTVSWNEAIGGLEFIDKPQKVNFDGCWKASSFIMNPYTRRTTDRQYWDNRNESESGQKVQNLDMHKMLCHRQHELLKLAEKYCLRDLTYDSDGLYAFLGLLRFLERRSWPPTLHISGLPYVAADTTQEVVEMYMAAVLCWYHTKSSNPRRRGHFPSWTWVEWAAPMRSIRLYTARLWVSHLRSMLLEHAGGSICLAAEYLRRGRISDGYPDSAIAIHFRAREVPAAFFAVGETNRGWGGLTVAGQSLLHEEMKPPTGTVGPFLDRIKNQVWSCLLLGDYWAENPFEHSDRRHLLVVEWLDGETASRAGLLLVGSRSSNDEEGGSIFSPEEDFPWRQVRLA